MKSRGPDLPQSITRRRTLAGAASALLGCGFARTRFAVAADADPRWYRAAAAMRQQAESWGDQPYGAVLVLEGALIGEGPSRVVKDRDPDAHAERVAIRDAQQRLGRTDLSGSILYSTSRPCSQCEAAAARANVSRMIHGPGLVDAGQPRSASR
jgi:tRNA(Arg) A34 adenosine deaminase TadA